MSSMLSFKKHLKTACFSLVIVFEMSISWCKKTDCSVSFLLDCQWQYKQSGCVP